MWGLKSRSSYAPDLILSLSACSARCKVPHECTDSADRQALGDGSGAISASVDSPPRHSASDVAKENITMKRLSDKDDRLKSLPDGVDTIDSISISPPAALSAEEVVGVVKTVTPSLTNADHTTAHANAETNQGKPSFKDVCTKNNLQTRLKMPHDVKSRTTNTSNDDIVDSDNDSHCVATHDHAINEVVAKAPSTVDAHAIAASSELSHPRASKDIPCSDEIVRIVECAVHDELDVLRMDHGGSVGTDNGTMSKEIVQDILENGDAPDEGGCSKQERLQGLDANLLKVSTNNIDESSLLSSSLDESSLSKSGKVISLPEAVWNARHVENTTNTKSLDDECAANNESIAVSVTERRSTTLLTTSASMSPDDARFPRSNKGLRRRDSCPPPFSNTGISSWNDSHLRAESIPRSTNILLVHRIPANTLPEQISGMFLEYTSVPPKSVKEISYTGLLGKCYVEFMSKWHAQMAYDALVGEEQLDSYGNVQKTVQLMEGGSLGVRKMYNMYNLKSESTLSITPTASVSSAGHSFVLENCSPVGQTFAPLSNEGLRRRDSCPPPFSNTGISSWSDSRFRAESIPRSTNILLVHRIPANTLPEHISDMFLKYTSIRPKSVSRITFLGILGKCYVAFMTSRHAQIAYNVLVGEEQLDSYGNVQKTVELMGGGTLGVRKMGN